VTSEPVLYTTLDSPIGELLLAGDGEVLHRLHMQDGRRRMRVEPHWRRDDQAFGTAREQLARYFAGEPIDFEVPLALSGTPFQLDVWRALQEIPYGETASYGEVARRIGRPLSESRAVGAANGSNPIAVIVPCHRVIGADGRLVGYGGGLDRKRLLLDLEAGRTLMFDPRPSRSDSMPPITPR
jgi:methylated-DNA-[protein]-cysteine S-methyltransferase